MKPMKLSSLLAALLSAMTLFSMSVLAQGNVWQNSYQLEAAGKYAEALAAIDSVPANGAEAELKTLPRGWLYYLLGSYNEAIREYRFAVDRNSQSVDARLGIVLPLLAQKRWREAEKNARESLELASNNYTGLLRLTLALEGQRDWPGMEKSAAAMVSHYPTDTSAYVYLARAYAWQGRPANASAAYTAVLARYPGHLEALTYINKNR